jgi:hypothetical protein
LLSASANAEATDTVDISNTCKMETESWLTSTISVSKHPISCGDVSQGVEAGFRADNTAAKKGKRSYRRHAT